MIKLILWDLDSTLIDFDIPERNSIIHCFEDFNLGPCPKAFLDEYHSINIKWWERLENGELTKPEILVGRFTEILSKYGYDASIATDFNEDYMNRLGDTVCPIENAVETVRALKGKVVQVIATNGVSRTQGKKIHGAGLDFIVDGIFVSEELGADKPNVVFYNKILERYPQFERNEIMMVGDSLSSDMTGANRAGIVSCWYNPQHKKLDRDLKIDFEIDDITQVMEVIK